MKESKGLIRKERIGFGSWMMTLKPMPHASKVSYPFRTFLGASIPENILITGLNTIGRVIMT